MIGLSEIQQQVRCIFCKGSRYPATIPRPTVAVAPFGLPLCETITTKGKFEEKHVRGKIMNHLMEKLLTEGYEVESQLEDNFKALSESLLRIFAMAVGSNCEALALEVAALMPNKKAVDAAIRYSLQKKCTALAEKLGEIALDKEAELLNEVEGPTEPEEFHRPAPSKSSVVFVDRSMAGDVLKPKSLKINSRSGGDAVSSDDEVEEVITTVSGDFSEAESEEEEETTVLRPKAVKLPPKCSLNPFKIAAQGASKKRTRHGNDSDEENMSQSPDVGFLHFFKEMREIFQNDNEDMDEEELQVAARDDFDSLSVDERKRWAKKAAACKVKLQKKMKAN